MKAKLTESSARGALARRASKGEFAASARTLIGMRVAAQRLVLIAMSIVLCAVMALAIASGHCPWWLMLAGGAVGLVSAGFAVWVALAPVEQLRSVWKQSWW